MILTRKDILHQRSRIHLPRKRALEKLPQWQPLPTLYFLKLLLQQQKKKLPQYLEENTDTALARVRKETAATKVKILAPADINANT